MEGIRTHATVLAYVYFMGFTVLYAHQYKRDLI